MEGKISSFFAYNWIGMYFYIHHKMVSVLLISFLKKSHTKPPIIKW